MDFGARGPDGTRLQAPDEGAFAVLGHHLLVKYSSPLVVSSRRKQDSFVVNVGRLSQGRADEESCERSRPRNGVLLQVGSLPGRGRKGDMDRADFGGD